LECSRCHPGLFAQRKDRDLFARRSETTYWVYILASGHHRTLYVGVTRDLQRRVEQHRSKAIPGFTRAFSAEVDTGSA